MILMRLRRSKEDEGSEPEHWLVPRASTVSGAVRAMEISIGPHFSFLGAMPVRPGKLLGVRGPKGGAEATLAEIQQTLTIPVEERAIEEARALVGKDILYHVGLHSGVVERVFDARRVRST